MRAAAVAAARELERRRPELITAAWWKEERGRRVFVDYNQNAPHKTVFGRVVGARPRRRPGLGAADLGRARRDPPGRADDRDRARAAGGATGDPWEGINDEPQSLEPLLELHERDRAAGLMDAPVAAGLPEAAGRAAAGRPEPRPPGTLTAGPTRATFGEMRPVREAVARSFGFFVRAFTR